MPVMRTIHTLLNAEENDIVKQGKIAAIASTGAMVADTYSNLHDVNLEDTGSIFADFEAYVKANTKKYSQSGKQQ